MKIKQPLFFLLATSLLLSACDAGKYYARKKINRHYEETVENKLPVTSPTVNTIQEESQPAEQVMPVLSDENNTPAPVHFNTKEQPQQNNTADAAQVNPTEETGSSIVPSQNTMEAKRPAEIKKETGEKSVGKGLLMILVALLLLLLGLLFYATLGTLGVVFGIVFYIGAVILFIAGVITMFINN